MNASSSRHLVSLVGLSMGLLMLLSAVPWSTLTDNTIKDFNLFEDLLPPPPPQTEPELVQLVELDQLAQPSEPTETAETVELVQLDQLVQLTTQNAQPAPVIDGTVAIEAYDPSQPPLPRLRAALATAASRTVRIAVIGDSYIEGDIFVQNLRSLMQQRYGGSGIGFTPLHSEFPGFRRSMTLASRGWTLHDIRSMPRRDSIRALSGDYCTATAATSTTIKGTSRLPLADRWHRTTFLCIAPGGGIVTITADGDSGASVTDTLAPSPVPQAIVLDSPTTSATITTDAPGIIALGAYADAATGVQVDCMSVRGNSGMTLGQLNDSLCTAMRAHADYSLIILEFGMNVIDPGRLDYTAYADRMQGVVARLRAIYPAADIIIMGTGDRASKASGTIASMAECTAMVNAQRSLARRTSAYFWDTRAAMGGDGAAIDWRKRKLLNADYIHLNHDGGAELASLFAAALDHALADE